jgi:prevent-host-death family protein
MRITKLSSRQFNQDSGRAKRAAARGPVIITDRGRPAHVLLTYDEYTRITGGRARIADLLSLPGAENAELETPASRDLVRAADLD